MASNIVFVLTEQLDYGLTEDVIGVFATEAAAVDRATTKERKTLAFTAGPGAASAIKSARAERGSSRRCYEIRRWEVTGGE